jgi:uncharacterized protein YjbI with pentapeptide repeats
VLAVVAPARAQDPPRNKWALLVGIKSYRQGKPLKYSVDDMTGLKGALATYLGFVEDNITLLTDAEAKQEAIKQSFEHLLGRAGAGDLVLFAFSGHGSSYGDEDDRKSYLLPYDFLGDNGEERLISLQDDIYKPLGKRKDISYKMVIIDACRNDPAKGPAPYVPGGILKARDNDILGQLERANAQQGRGTSTHAFELEYPPKGVFALASCTDDQFSWEDNTLGHGVFMNFVIEGITGKAVRDDNTGVLDGDYLSRYAHDQTIEHLRDQVQRDPRTQQTPFAKNNTQVPPILGQPGRVGVTMFRGQNVSSGSRLHAQFMEHARKFGLENADLRGTTLDGVNLTGVSLGGARLAKAKLRKVVLPGADLTGADLTEADATGAVFKGSVAASAIFKKAILRFADFERADTRFADFDGADTYGARGLRLH